MKLLESGISLSEIAQRIDGDLIGDSAIVITSLCALDEPIDGALAFTNEKIPVRLIKKVNESKAAAVIIDRSIFIPEGSFNRPTIGVTEPLAAMVRLVPQFYFPVPFTTGVSSKADIHPTAKLGKNVSVGAFSVIGENVVIGDNTIIHPNVTIYPDTVIGKNVTVHSGASIREDCRVADHCMIQNGAVVGSDGFGYIPDKDTGLKPVPQIGVVSLAERVDIGANSCVDRATFGTTEIGCGTKLDNLVQVGHNTKIGKFTILCGQVGIAGSTSIGNKVIIGGAAGVKDHCIVVDEVRVGAASAVISDLLTKGDYVGHPAEPAFTWRRKLKAMELLPGMLKDRKKVK